MSRGRRRGSLPRLADDPAALAASLTLPLVSALRKLRAAADMNAHGVQWTVGAPARTVGEAMARTLDGLGLVETDADPAGDVWHRITPTGHALLRLADGSAPEHLQPLATTELWSQPGANDNARAPQ